jgi:hypothetical protein
MIRTTKCHKCKEVITEKYKMVSLDVPYRNLFFHPWCYDEIIGEIEEYLKINAESILHNYPSESVKIKKKW